MCSGKHAVREGTSWLNFEENDWKRIQIKGI